MFSKRFYAYRIHARVIFCLIVADIEMNIDRSIMKIAFVLDCTKRDSIAMSKSNIKNSTFGCKIY